MISSLNSYASKSAGFKIYNTKIAEFINQDVFLNSIPLSANIVLSESHYTPSIQIAQGKIIEDIIKKTKQSFSVFWEFLITENQKSIDIYFNKLKNRNLSIKDFFKKVFPNGNIERNLIYAPIIETAVQYNGLLMSSNASRIIKRKITSNGLDSLSPAEIPYNMEIGSDHYLTRFKVAMGNHVPAEKIPFYFEAQSYTDSFMANSLTHMANTALKFLIVGSFHADYNDAVISQIKKISDKETISIKIIKVENFDAQSLKQYISKHRNYGALADIIYFVQ